MLAIFFYEDAQKINQLNHVNRDVDLLDHGAVLVATFVHVICENVIFVTAFQILVHSTMWIPLRIRGKHNYLIISCYI